METKESLTERFAGVGKRQQKQLEARAQQGQRRALELVWSQSCQAIHFPVSSFTDRQIGELSDLRKRFALETVPLIQWSIRSWRGMGLPGMPPMPVFEFFYSRRDIFWSHYQSEKIRKEKIIAEQVFAPIPTPSPPSPETPKVSLMDLFLKEREKANAAKSTATNE